MGCSICERIQKIEVRTVERGCTPAEAEEAARKLVALRAEHDPGTCKDREHPGPFQKFRDDIDRMAAEFMRRMWEKYGDDYGYRGAAYESEASRAARDAHAKREQRYTAWADFGWTMVGTAFTKKTDGVEYRVWREGKHWRAARDGKAYKKEYRREDYARRRLFRYYEERLAKSCRGAADDAARTTEQKAARRREGARQRREEARREAKKKQEYEFLTKGWERGPAGETKTFRGVALRVWNVGNRSRASRDGVTLPRTYRSLLEAKYALLAALEPDPAEQPN